LFAEFFYLLREQGVPVTPTGFLKLQDALSKGCISSLEDLYAVGRAVLVKSERFFDLYDRVFLHSFKGAQLDFPVHDRMDEAIRRLLEDWLKDPREMADFLGIDPETLARLTPEELEEYFRRRLAEQTERHDGGDRWIGTGGTSPVGHSGFHPGGMRVGGASRMKSAVKVALERRYRDYTQDTLLGPAQISDALKRLRHMVPSGPKDRLNIDETIKATLKNAGEIEIVFDSALKDKLKVVLMIDNGGFSMDPYVRVVQVVFNHARNNFKDLQVFYFHNTVYSHVWRDPQRYERPFLVEDFARLDPATRLIIVGDASMAPYELFSRNGAITYNSRSGPSIQKLEFLAKTFRHSVWLNPKYEYSWPHTQTIGAVSEIFPMFEITLAGLEKAVGHLMRKN
jgi:uncharacterized protein with von Willebrand factor type A (vWA) domain